MYWTESREHLSDGLEDVRGQQFIGPGAWRGAVGVALRTECGPGEARRSTPTRPPGANNLYSIVSNFWRYHSISISSVNTSCPLAMSPMVGHGNCGDGPLVLRFEPKFGAGVRSPAATEGSCSLLEIERRGRVEKRSDLPPIYYHQ
jgi:hypothetical protein